MSPYGYRDGLKDGLPIGLGYLMVSVGFGISAVNHGLSVLTAVLISMTNLTSAGQVAGLEILMPRNIAVLSVSCLEMFLTQLLINLRYSLMGISLSQKLDGSFTTGRRMLTGYFITDEIFAVASSKQSPIGVRYMLGLATLPFCGWAAGTAAGAAVADLMPSRISSIFEIAIYGMFISIVVPETKHSRGILFSALAASAVSCLLYYLPVFSFISSGFRIIISAVAVCLLAAWLFPVEDSGEVTG